MNIDTHHDGAVLNPTFYMAGWAIDAAAAAGTGVDTIHVWALPAERRRRDVPRRGDLRRCAARRRRGARRRFTNSGWHLTATGLAPGLYTIGVYAAQHRQRRLHRLARLHRDGPAERPHEHRHAADRTRRWGVRSRIAGWAVDLAATSGTGVDTVHVWATPTDGGAATFLGVADYGFARPDVGTAVGNHQFDNCGFSLVGGGSLAPGTYTISVYGHSTVANAFTIAPDESGDRAVN